MILKSGGNEIKWLDNFLQNKKNLNIIRVVLILGIILLSLGSFMPKRSKVPVSYKTEEVNLEQRIEETISEIAGVGKAKVLITYKTKGELIPATDISESSTMDDGRNSKSKDEKVVLANTSGVQSPVIVKEFSPQVQGIVVVAQGGDNLKVKQNIIDAITALCDVSPHNIGVFERKSK